MTAGQPKLAELQQWFLDAVTQIQPASDPAAVNRAVTASRSQTPAERLEVYRRAYFARLLEVLREQFPCTRFAVGDELFDQFALGYLERYPPRGYTLGRLAERLVEHLHKSRPANAAWGGFVVELAALEQAIDRIFDGPGPERLLPFELPADATGDLHLRLVPGFELHAFTHPVSTFFTQWKAGEQPAWPQPEPQFVALFRRDYIVRRLELTAMQHVILQGLIAEQTVAEAVSAAASEAINDHSPDLAVSVRESFLHWAAAGIFAEAYVATAE